MWARLPQQKVQKYQNDILQFMSKSKATLLEFQKLIGRLQWATSAVKPGRPFIRRLIDLTKGVREQHHFIRITNQVVKDLKVWYDFLCQYNGYTMFIPDRTWFNDELQLFSDASHVAAAALCEDKWLVVCFPDEWKSLHISVLEFYPLLLAVTVFSQVLENKRVLFNSDNMAVVQAVNSQTSKSPQLMVLLRMFVFVCLKSNIACRARHIQGIKNVRADRLSRLKFDEDYLINNHLQVNPVQVPAHLMPEQLTSALIR